jgi:ribosomal protein S18 acetylase RimI-like enzyme
MTFQTFLQPLRAGNPAMEIGTGPLERGDRERVREILVATQSFRASEIEVALELFDEVFPPENSPRGAALASPTAGADNTAVSTPDYSFLGAFTPEQELIGYACWGPTPDTDRTFDLYWIAVDPGVQGSGSGTILLREVERRLAGQSARLLVVETSSRSDYESARAFYLRRGYAEAGRVREFYAPSDDRIIFTKRFPTSASYRGGVTSP